MPEIIKIKAWDIRVSAVGKYKKLKHLDGWYHISLS